MTTLDHRFGSLEIFAGSAVPLTYDQRDMICAAAVSGDYERVTALVKQHRVAQLPYLIDLFGLAPNTPSELVWDQLRIARATKLAMPDDTPLADVLAEELKCARAVLQMFELKRSRDQRLGTYIPLRNGDW